MDLLGDSEAKGKELVAGQVARGGQYFYLFRLAALEVLGEQQNPAPVQHEMFQLTLRFPETQHEDRSLQIASNASKSLYECIIAKVRDLIPREASIRKSYEIPASLF